MQEYRIVQGYGSYREFSVNQVDTFCEKPVYEIHCLRMPDLESVATSSLFEKCHLSVDNDMKPRADLI